MNHIYRVIFNRSLGVYQCVSELAKSGGKSSGRATVSNKSGVILSALSVAVLGMGMSGSVQAATYNSSITLPDPHVIDNDQDIIENAGTLVNSSNITIAEIGLGNLEIRTGGQLYNVVDVVIGKQNPSNGSVIVKDIGSKLTSDEDLIIGEYGKGTVTVENGGLIEVGYDVYLGYYQDSEGTLIVKDVGSKLTSDDDLIIGEYGKGTVTVENGGSIDVLDDVELGYYQDSEGTLIVKDVGSTLTSGYYLIIGEYGKGTVTVENGGLIEVEDDIRLAYEIDSEGTLIVKDIGSTLTSDDDLIIGFEGKGSVIVENGGSIDVLDDVRLAYYADGEGTLIVKNVGSRLSSEDLIIGSEGNGTVTVENGGSIDVADYVYLGYYADGEGTLIVKDIGSTLTIGEDLVIGDDGKGAVTVENGGSIVTSANTLIGRSNSSNGTLKVDGKDSKLDTGLLLIGEDGTGSATIANKGQVIASNVVRSTSSPLSTLNFDGGTLVLKGNQADLFSGFNSDRITNSINLQTLGGTIDTQGNDVVINTDAVIGGVGSLTKSGTGKLTMNNTVKKWDGNTTISQGTLQINGKYEMRTGEVLAIGLNNGDDTSPENGKLVVKGEADISQGKLQVNASDAVKALGNGNTWKNVIVADTLTGTFANTGNLLGNSPLVSFVDDYDTPHAVNLTMIVAPPPPVVTPPVVVPPVVVPPVAPPPIEPEKPNASSAFVRSLYSQGNLNDFGIATVLDRAIDDRVNNGANALADALISDTINFSVPQLAAAANQLQPLAMGATNRIITDTNYIASDAISTHSPTTSNRSLWATVIGSKASHDTDNGISGYDAESTGVITGLDLPINNNLNLGVAVSYIDTDIDTTSRLDHGITAKSWQVLGYGGYNITDATHLNFHAGAGRSDVDGTRRLPLLTNAIAQSDYNVDTLQAGLGVRHQIGTQERNFSPFGQVSYAQAKSDSYSESGAGAYNLNVDGNTYESMRWTAGLEMAQALSPRFLITGKLAAAIENGDKYSKVSANFAAMPDESFSTIGHEVGREIGVLGLGLSYQPTPRTTLSAGYQGEWRDNYDDQGASVSLQTWF